MDRKLYYKQWHQEHKEEENIKARKYGQIHKEQIRIRMKQYRLGCKEQKNKYQKNYIKTRRKIDIQFYLLTSLRRQLYMSLKRYTNGKSQSSKAYGIDWTVCCKKLMETTPINFERNKFHIDHIKPLSSFDLTDAKQIKQAFSPDNLQWLEASENIHKSDKY